VPDVEVYSIPKDDGFLSFPGPTLREQLLMDNYSAKRKGGKLVGNSLSTLLI
jgi:hypothetical protein